MKVEIKMRKRLVEVEKIDTDATFVALPIDKFLEIEPICEFVWSSLTLHFKTRSKALKCLRKVDYVIVAVSEDKVYKEKQPVGFAFLSSGIDWALDYVCVCPAFRGQSIAREMVKFACNYAFMHHQDALVLTCKEKLVPLYSSLGFKEF